MRIAATDASEARQLHVLLFELAHRQTRPEDDQTERTVRREERRRHQRPYPGIEEAHCLVEALVGLCIEHQGRLALLDHLLHQARGEQNL